MIQKTFDALAKADVDALIADSVGESKTLEYKQELPGPKDDDKREFLADVSSFANASGGDIIYGIKAAVDASGKKTGAPDSVVPIVSSTPDHAKLRLEEMIRNGIDPRLRVQIKEITGWGADGQAFVILLRIPKSFASPHMVTLKGTSRFFSRNSAGKYQLDVAELRTSFLATESQAERIKRFREDRLGKIIADETPVMLSSPHRLVLHLIPLGPFLNNERVDLSQVQTISGSFQPIRAGGWNCRYNLDGFLTFEAQHVKDQGHDSYCQVFFNSAVEAVFSDLLRGQGGGRVGAGTGFIDSVAYEKYLIDAVQSYLKGFKQLGLTPPVAVSLALLGCRGSFMYCVDARGLPLDNPHPIDRDYVLLPDLVIDSLDVEVPQIMRPIFDVVWNACGLPRSLNYDKEGKWKPRG